MIVTCERCNARYKLDDSRIKGRGARITCPKCRHVFTILAEQPVEPAPGPAPPAEAAVPEPGIVEPAAPIRIPRLEVPQGAADRLDFRKVGIAAWKVKVKNGLVYDFSDVRTLRKYIQDHRVTEDDVISWDGARWTRIGDIENLDAFFLHIYEERTRFIGSGPPLGDTEDAPTVVVGMGTLGINSPTGVFRRSDLARETSPAPMRPAPTGNDASIPQFVDPFEALKRSRAKARELRSPSGDSTTAGSATHTRWRLVLVVCIGVVALLTVVWFVGSRPAPQVVPPPPGEAAAQGLKDANDFRAKMLDRIEQQLEQRDPLPLEPEPQEALRPVVPPGATLQRGTSTALSLSIPVAPVPVTAVDLVAGGDTLMAASDWNAAASAYARAVTLEPGNARYRARYGEALYRADRPDEAWPELEAASKAGVSSAHKFLGHIARDRNDTPSAMAHYRAYLETEPPDRAAVEQALDALSDG